MISSPVEPVYYSWRTRLHDRIALMKDASMNGDTAVSAALTVQNQSASVDSLATLYKKADAYGPEVLDNTKQIMSNLQTKAEGGTKDAKADTDGVKGNMDALQKSPDGKKKESWRERLRKDIAAQKKKSGDRWDALGKFGEEQIDKLPNEDLKNNATDIYTTALTAINTFISKAVEWLENAWRTVTEWFQKAWEAVKEFARKAVNWFEGAWNTVKRAFGARGATYLASVCSEDSEGDFTQINSLPDMESITNKLKDTDLDNITLVRKGASWVMEVPV
ncbi:hypothetical protein N7527_011277 [Penicillium freii]|uniref:Uncharacterized protein n=1 Tax=Penicillium freii TaxID=48697 RepID=A0A101M941_PENFR|nr:hypothetical protein N7527_011277 [Penicillium freii]KUM56222.1 hypothetical protein ACN42_g10999 [Penicillium freii]